MHKLTEVLAGAALDYLCNHPEARRRMVFELAADRPFEPPFRESLEALALVEPIVLRIRRVRKSADVEQNLLDGHLIFTVSAKLRDNLRDDLARTELSFADQNPRRRRHDRFGAREDRVERVVGRRLFTTALNCATDCAHRADFSIAGDRDLRRGQQAVLNFAFSTSEKGFDFRGIETYFAWTICKMILRRHCEPLLSNCPRGITHHCQFVIRTKYEPDLATKSIPPCLVVSYG